MADLNKLMRDIQDESTKIKGRLKTLLIKYDSLYKDGNRQFIHEKVSSNDDMEGLEDFRRLTLIFKRNKDVVASLVRGMDNLRSMKSFEFIEEDVPPPRIGTKKQKKKEKKESQKIESMHFDFGEENAVEVPEPIERPEVTESEINTEEK